MENFIFSNLWISWKRIFFVVGGGDLFVRKFVGRIGEELFAAS
jgi:hypothetical protein